MIFIYGFPVRVIDYQMFKLFSLICICGLALYFNLPKIQILEDIYTYGGNYTIYPWMVDGKLSDSTPLWLITHLYLAIFHMTLTIFWIIDIPDLKIHQISHWLFTIHTGINIHHFGEASVPVSLIANGTPLFLMNLIYNYYPKRKMLYFYALTLPVVFETVLYLKNNI
jgi:hypothetical protein